MNDFADWLSPIVVKELRQGMRARAFMGIFLAIQFFMIVCVFVSLGSDSNSLEGVTGLFWFLLGAALLGAMPLRGINSLHGEIKEKTLELMLLTQLSAWRITAGKWLALVLQTFLLVCSVLPYVVLRYFIGGVDLIHELIVLGWLIAGSCLLTALFVGLSPFMKSIVFRIILGACVPLMLIILMSITVNPRTTVFGPPMASWVWAALVIGPLAILELFEVGVGKIAPVAENHSSRKRLIALLVCALAAGLGWALAQRGFFAVIAAMVCTPVMLGALLEENIQIPSLYLPFTRRKLLGRLAGKFLYPGWATGLLFFTLVAVLFLGFASLKWSDQKVAFNIAAGLEGLLLPLVLVRLAFRKARNILPFYLGFQLMLFVTAIIFSANFSHNDPHLSLIGLVPTMGFFLHLWGNDSFGQLGFAAFNFGAAGVSLVGLFVLSLPGWKSIRAMEREADACE
ncbi:MAG: ABC transporter permease [Chthoniobacteraceae bacterium]